MNRVNVDERRSRVEKMDINDIILQQAAIQNFSFYDNLTLLGAPLLM